MAELVGVFAAGHAPLIARDWDQIPEARRTPLAAAYDELGRRLKAARPDIVVEIAPDHWVNFFLDNLPSVCIGVGEEHDGPPEPFMIKAYPHHTLPGHAAFGRHLLETALAHDFEPAFSHRLRLDHGFCIPLWRMKLDPPPAIVPLIVNDIEAPMPSIARCAAWGHLLRRAIETYPENLRVAVLASGGLSHSVGEPTMGRIYEDFDHECIALFASGEEKTLIDFLTDGIPRAGNGADEIRNWVVAHTAAGGKGFELISYLPVPEVYVGCGFASWNVA